MYRRRFLGAAASAATALAGVGCELSPRHAEGEGSPDSVPPVVDTHMHVWANDASRFPYAHPYVAPDTRLVSTRYPAPIASATTGGPSRSESHWMASYSSVLWRWR